MKRIRLIISLLVISSVISVHTVQANASTTGWNGNSSEGWWYVDNAGNYVTGWQQIQGQWYYFDTFGWMLSNTTINGYTLGSNGAWTTSKSDYFKNSTVKGGSGAGDGSLARANRDK